MTRRFLYILCGVLAVVAPSSSQQTEWKDPSPHVVKLLEVDTDVRLEVLDWGGSGPALLLWPAAVIRLTFTTILRRHWPNGTASSG